MQTDRNARRHVTYEPIRPEMALTSLPGNSSNNSFNLSLVPADYYRDIGFDMRNYDDSDENLLGRSIAFLGSSKVGKTSILQQFLNQDFEDQYVPSTTCTKYRKAVYMNGRIYDMTLRDCPGVVHFPENTVTEWTEYKGYYGLHLSQVFVLVYDTSSEDTFNYIKSMREQILQQKGSETMIIVVGNKQDLTDPRNTFLKTHMQSTAKKWKCPFVFCSAKYNWHVVKVFQEILKMVEAEIDSKKDTGHRNNNRWINMSSCKVS